MEKTMAENPSVYRDRSIPVSRNTWTTSEVYSKRKTPLPKYTRTVFSATTGHNRTYNARPTSQTRERRPARFGRSQTRATAGSDVTGRRAGGGDWCV